MAWRIELAPAARQDLDDLDSQAARRLLAFLNDRVAVLDNPRSIGRALRGSDLGGFWRYRVGDYRIVAAIEDRLLRILVVRAGLANMRWSVRDQS